jgi:hypothetical protein
VPGSRRLPACRQSVCLLCTAVCLCAVQAPPSMPGGGKAAAVPQHMQQQMELASSHPQLDRPGTIAAQLADRPGSLASQMLDSRAGGMGQQAERPGNGGLTSQSSALSSAANGRQTEHDGDYSPRHRQGKRSLNAQKAVRSRSAVLRASPALLRRGLAVECPSVHPCVCLSLSVCLSVWQSSVRPSIHSCVCVSVCLAVKRLSVHSSVSYWSVCLFVRPSASVLSSAYSAILWQWAASVVQRSEIVMALGLRVLASRQASTLGAGEQLGSQGMYLIRSGSLTGAERTVMGMSEQTIARLAVSPTHTHTHTLHWPMR